MCDKENQNFELNNTNMYEVTQEDIKFLINLFAEKSYNAGTENPEMNAILQSCIQFMELDYSVAVVQNDLGELSYNYPRQLPILEYEKKCYAVDHNLSLEKTKMSARKASLSPPQTNNIKKRIDVQKTREVFNNAKFSRCRTRFPIPVIMYKNKYICRSSTLSRGFEIYGRSGLELFDSYILQFLEKSSKDENQASHGTLTESVGELEDIAETAANNENSGTAPPQFFDQVRNNDIELLKYFNVETIVDLMVENQKVKYGMYMSSSEKVEKSLYVDFKLISMPYPGCEFFKDFRDQAYEAEGLHFNFDHSQCDASLNIPEDPSLAALEIDWDTYKSWDLITLTQNYIKFILQGFENNTSSILVHCISGWDRTPLFISLLRLSLWADGLIHNSLDEYQILYLTIAYDWMLFGHQLNNRLNKREEIFFFCFFMLKYLPKNEFDNSPGRNSVNNQDPLEASVFAETSGTSPIANPTGPSSDYSESPMEDRDTDGFSMVGPTGSLEELSSEPEDQRGKRLRKLRNIFYVCYFNSGAQNIKYTLNSSFETYLSNISQSFGFFSKTDKM